MSIFPRAMVDEIGSVDVRLRHCEDWELWIRAVFAGYRVVLQPRPSALYRWSTAGLSGQLEHFRAAEREVLRRVAARDDLSPAERSVVTGRLAAPAAPVELASRADAALRDGRFRDAARDYAAAAALAPTESVLVAKARLMRAAPWAAGPALAWRMRKRDRVLGVDDRHVR
jgi:hypothetical protein